ncbi:Gfo/Idh/MocA family protein [Adhaeribacter pallidiroseus]|uniref:Glucose-fructose oxidoreductase n=1 Tax=Adhaeribacter pallidiroseus TaxID=2072847 RepID=A0A369QJL3_9BACT|nr:Gfo/Idh/MocA family oxidoreductase [Adhaeribacter pallidiroseus]RDC63437.1 Glucose-fructose oxidoreductase [Adhaeribacter pallidiroseus]
MKKLRFTLPTNRRQFLKNLSLTLGTTATGLSLLSLQACNSKNNEQTKASAEQNRKSGKLGIALLGLGKYSTGQLAPALQETQNCYLAGIITGSPEKADKWKNQYDIPDKNVYSYENFDQIKDNPAIDIVYVVTPNALHREFVVRAAQAKKHVICEKPMATTVEDCQAMIEACKQNNVQLSVGYRLHFEPHNQRVMELGQKAVFGPVKSIKAADSFKISVEPDDWRLNKQLAGGGPLMDVGIYCVQGVMYTLGQEPIAITAKFGENTRPDYFKTVEQSISWQMQFKGGLIAECVSSYNDEAGMLYGEAQNGWWRLDPAYSYAGITGETSQGKMDFEEVNQQARQMDNFADCVRHNKPTPVPGQMGLRDVKILLAIYEAAQTNKKVGV